MSSSVVDGRSDAELLAAVIDRDRWERWWSCVPASRAVAVDSIGGPTLGRNRGQRTSQHGLSEAFNDF
jgi:hypothetical protein